jgi:hypothetical protein
VRESATLRPQRLQIARIAGRRDEPLLDTFSGLTKNGRAMTGTQASAGSTGRFTRQR